MRRTRRHQRERERVERQSEKCLFSFSDMISIDNNHFYYIRPIKLSSRRHSSQSTFLIHLLPFNENHFFFREEDGPTAPSSNSTVPIRIIFFFLRFLRTHRNGGESKKKEGKGKGRMGLDKGLEKRSKTCTCEDLHYDSI